MLKPEFLSMILSAAVSLLTLFTFFQSRMTSTEKRLTVLEEKNKQNDKELEETKGRLDNHDLQMQVLIQMTEQIKNTIIGGRMMMINYFAMQIELGWITIEQVPKRFRKQVQDLLDLSHAGLQDDNAAE